VVLFAFSTMISWSYYGLKAGPTCSARARLKELVFKVIFCIFVVIGAAASLGPVIDFSDAAIFAMAVVNIFCALLPDEAGEAVSCAGDSSRRFVTGV
jgi:AGCS family alanine or glycine:cation symporter